VDFVVSGEAGVASAHGGPALGRQWFFVV